MIAETTKAGGVLLPDGRELGGVVAELRERVERLEAGHTNQFNRLCSKCGLPHNNKGSVCWHCKVGRGRKRVACPLCSGKGKIELTSC